MLGKFQFINNTVAQNLGVDPARVARVTDFFMEQLNEDLKNPEHAFLYVRGLGTFTLCLAPIEKRLRLYIPKLRKKEGIDEIRTYEKISVALTKTVFELFALRRLLKRQRGKIKKLRDARKTKNDIEGQPLPVNR